MSDPASASPHPSSRPSASAVLERLADVPEGHRIRFGDITGALDERAFGVAIVALAAPCLVPMPLPGFGLLFGAPLLIITLQLLIGLPRPWLPRALSDRSLDAGTWRKIMGFVSPRLHRIEKILTPRLPWMSSRAAERITGFIAVLVVGLLLLPVPFTNIPLGLILCLIGLGLFERDGVVLLIGWGLSLVAIGIAAGAAVTGGTAVLSMLG
ncbi:exopolysaccharide biosynthesis protein [Novispirillum itersonii]|uniref:Exopolysaccharide biosynthesis protein n=1 Tax=Novispirillum itersonii TaxID=189 RepID=A0A7W9ZFY7_NOVIT|nr:exopolysaccharide biosynthesis protein [Novispirillum itersonii]MBB6210515.1 hypothetical protein [Novispirillum itersonii]